MRSRYVAGVLAFVACSSQAGEPVLMSGEWGVAACQAWNADPVLTQDLAASGWIKNDKGRGYKIMQVFREDCGDQPTVELRVALEDGAARCIYGGPVQQDALDRGADYVMHAKTARWLEMGRGEYGPMKGMMLGRLSFSGPYTEAMGNMGPFTNFLLLVGKVPADTQTCPE
jgi:putative sterol carrier protein